MQVTLKPPLRDLSTMFALEVVYKDKLLEQFDGKEEKAKLAHDSWHDALKAIELSRQEK